MKVIRSVQSLLFVLSIMVNAVLLPVGLVLLDASYAVRAQSASTGPEIVFASSR